MNPFGLVVVAIGVVLVYIGVKQLTGGSSTSKSSSSGALGAVGSGINAFANSGAVGSAQSSNEKAAENTLPPTHVWTR